MSSFKGRKLLDLMWECMQKSEKLRSGKYFFPCTRSCILLCTTFAFEKQLTEWQILEKSLQLSSHLDEAPGFHFRSTRRNRHKYTINLAGIYRTITQKQTKRKKVEGFVGRDGILSKLSFYDHLSTNFPHYDNCCNYKSFLCNDPRRHSTTLPTVPNNSGITQSS